MSEHLAAVKLHREPNPGMPDGKIEGPGRKLSVVALTETANSERGKVANFMVGDNLIITVRCKIFCSRVFRKKSRKAPFRRH